MKHILILVILFFTISLHGQFETKNYIDQNYIEVNGKSEMEITPDMIFLKVTINEKDTRNKVPLQKQEHAMIEALKNLDIDIEEDLSIVDFTSNFKNYILGKKEIELSKEYQILVKDSNTAGQIFIELEELGISNISIDRLDHSNIIELRKEVRINAVKEAKKKAEYLANAIDQSIGRAIHITEVFDWDGKTPKNSNFMLYMKRDFDDSNRGHEEIEFEKIKIFYSYDCKFELI